jgi:hypothetical protein
MPLVVRMSESEGPACQVEKDTYSIGIRLDETFLSCRCICFGPGTESYKAIPMCIFRIKYTLGIRRNRGRCSLSPNPARSIALMAFLLLAHCDTCTSIDREMYTSFLATLGCLSDTSYGKATAGR